MGEIFFWTHQEGRVPSVFFIPATRIYPLGIRPRRRPPKIRPAQPHRSPPVLQCACRGGVRRLRMYSRRYALRSGELSAAVAGAAGVENLTHCTTFSFLPQGGMHPRNSAPSPPARGMGAPLALMRCGLCFSRHLARVVRELPPCDRGAAVPPRPDCAELLGAAGVGNITRCQETVGIRTSIR